MPEGALVDAFRHLADVVKQGSDIKDDQMYAILLEMEWSLKGSPKSAELESRELWDAMEGAFGCTKLLWGHGLKSIMAVVYTDALRLAPAFLLRGTFSTLVGIAGGKLATCARECAIYVLGKIALEHGENLGTAVVDAVATLSKVIRSYDLAVRTLPSDVTLRQTVYQALAQLVRGSPVHTGPSHADLVKVAAKWITADKSADVRLAVSVLLEEIAAASSGFKTVSMEAVSSTAAKGFLDECVDVAMAFTKVVAKCYAVQITAQRENEEAARADLARGGAAGASSDAQKAAEQKQSSSLSAKFKEAVSMKKKVVDKYDFETMFAFQVTQLTTGEKPYRNANLFVLHFLVVEMLPQLSRSEMEGLIKALVGILKAPGVLAMSHEEATLTRTRLSYTFRAGIFSNVVESTRLECVRHLLAYMSNLDGAGSVNRATLGSNDMELVFVLNEMAHAVHLLGEAAAAVVENIEGPAMTLLRSPNFEVRTSAVYLLLSTSSAAPLIGARYFRDALEYSKAQARQLLTDNADDGGGRRKSSKDTEKQQRLFLMHGQVFLISMFMKNIKELPTGIPMELIVDAIEFGLSLLANDITRVTEAQRPILGNVMKAGGLIVSSALSVGFDSIKYRIPSVLSTIKFLLSIVDSTTTPTPSSDALSEIMAIESMLTVVSALLWFCPESLRMDETCLGLVADSLEKIFKVVKQTYQPKFRGQYRFMVIHTMLLECFSWLPVGSYPQSSTALYTEAMRTFKESVEAGFESSWLSYLTHADHGLLRPSTLGRRGTGSISAIVERGPSWPN